MHIAQGYAAWIRAQENQQFLKKSRRINKDPSAAFLAFFVYGVERVKWRRHSGSKVITVFLFFRAVACQPAILIPVSYFSSFFHELQSLR
jgi:hypothetical protein